MLKLYDTKDAVPEALRSAAIETKDGKFAADEPAADDATELKETLKKLRKELDEAGDARKALERKLAAAEHGGDGKEKDKVTKALEKFDADLAAAKADFEKKLAVRDGELRTLKLDEKAKAAFLKAGGRPERADAALRLKKDALDIDGDRIVIKNEKGETTTTTIDDFWSKSFKVEMPEYFIGTKATGGGANGGAGAHTGGGTKWDGDAVIKDPLGALQAANAESAGAK